MTVSVRPLTVSRYMPDALAIQYTAPAATRTVIDKFTVSNVSATPISFDVHLVPSGESAGLDNANIYQRVVSPGGSYLCPEVTGHVLETSGFISVVASAADSIVFRVSGREIVNSG